MMGARRRFLRRLGEVDRDDYYRFDLKERRNVSLRLNGLRADAGLELFNQVNQIVTRSYQAGTAEESIRTILDPGTYRLRVFSFDGVETNYNLSVSDNNLSVLEQLQSPTLIRAGTLGADQFTLTPGYRRYVFSGNGNVDYGAGLFDRLDLSAFSSSSVRWNPVTANGTGGVRYNPGNGDRLFDQLLLSDGREILLEGIEKIVFQNESLATGFINAGLTVNPSDPLFTRQWNLHMMGVHTAWRFTTGSNSVLIGVQDGGIALTNEGKSHPDFRSNAMHTTPGNDSADDFFDVPKNKPDLFGHGTAVLGIIAAASNNGTGMSGINWVSPVISADVLGGNRGDISSEQAIRQWAEATQPVGGSGQRLIINMSFTSPVSEDFRNLVRQYQDRILFVISSGNDSQSTLPTPSVLASDNLNVIAVGASWGKQDRNGKSQKMGDRIPYSNYGSGITLMGPAEVITTKAEGSGNRTIPPKYTYTTNASPFDGTSSAAPNVAGVASLVWSANPTLTAAQVRQILSETAIDVGTPGYDLFTGYGFVNADAAVRRAMAIARA
ncbi:subtilisin-like serine protease [Leptolyngbyaceae cyanobacterium JSC-12]|nr:subtilisin-like serine protease [Leptolyngbyaceae cyanobacterium JSC-12]